MINDTTGFPLFVTDQWKGKRECVCRGAHEHAFLKAEISFLLFRTRTLQWDDQLS